MLVGTFYIFLMLLNGVIALYDFSFYRIPNVLVLLLILIYCCSAPFLLSFSEILISSGIFAGTLAVGFLLFFFGIFGGGDAKYLAVTGMWAGSEHYLPFILITTLAGGALALIYLLSQRIFIFCSSGLWNQILLVEKRYTKLRYVWSFSGKGPETHKEPAIKGNVLPYGVAISFGMIVTLYLNLTT